MPDATIHGFSKSAFVQYRKKIKPEVFKSLSDSLIEEFYADNDDSIKRWKGFRLLAVDGSRLILPNTMELESIYGKTRNQSETGVVQARILRSSEYLFYSLHKSASLLLGTNGQPAPFCK